MTRSRGVSTTQPRTLRRRTVRPRTMRPLAALVALTLAGALGACGTIPPGATAGRTASARPTGAPQTGHSSASHAGTPTPTSLGPTVGPAPSTGPGPSSSTGSSTKNGPSTGTGSSTSGGTTTSASDVWVGHFQGREVRVPRGHGASMSFTFDDGPWPGSTSQVLALLAQNHVHAVFCLIGNQAQAHPALVRAEVAGGHELCDHSRDHDLSMRPKGARYVDAEVGDGLAQVRRAAPHGTPVTFYRQPGGLWNPLAVAAMDAYGLDPLRWTDDPRDWSRPGSAVIVRRVVAGLRPGAVVLMHDGGGDRSESVEALRFLLHAVVAAGWKPVLAPHVHLSAKAAARPQ